MLFQIDSSFYLKKPFAFEIVVTLFEKQILPLKSKPLAEESLLKARNLEHSLFMSRQLLFHFGCLCSVRVGLVGGRQLNAWDFLV